MRVCLGVFWVSVLFLGSACSKQGPQVALQDGLSASMQDDQILHVLNLDPAKMQAKKEQGPDGDSIIYTDEMHEIWITRSVVSGVIVMRMKPENQLKIWKLGKQMDGMCQRADKIDPLPSM